MKKEPIKKKTYWPSPLERVRRVANQIIDYQREHDCYVTIVKGEDDSLLNVLEMTIIKEDLEHPVVQKFLKGLLELFTKEGK